jgi:hypothetical protein
MQLRPTRTLVAAFVAWSLASSAHAGVIKVIGIEIGTGVDPAGEWEYSTVPFLTGVDFTRVSLAELATVTLTDFDVLYVGELFLEGLVTVPAQTALDALNARAADIDTFIAGGGGVLALPEPIGNGRFAWVPDAIEPMVSTDFISDDSVGIVAPGHPVMAGLTDEGLSGWNVASHGDFRSTAGLDVLVDNGAGRPITLAGTYGLGRIVITDQDADFHNARGTRKPDQIRFIQNALEWLAPRATEIPLPSTLSLLVPGVAILFRRCSRRSPAGSSHG